MAASPVTTESEQAMTELQFSLLFLALGMALGAMLMKTYKEW